jgi:hypothetical protein
LSPANGASVGAANPILTWSPVAGATRYRVQVSASPSFSSLLYNTYTFATKATPYTQLPFGTLYWRVAGDDGAGNNGPFAEASFVETLTQAPVTLTPTDGQTLTFPAEPVIFSWNPVPGATSYSVQVDSAESFVSATQYTTKNTSFTLTDTQSFTQADGTTQSWYWRVQANLAASQVGPWSEGQSYQIEWPAAPQLRSPAPLANVTDIVLSWDPIAGAQSYEVQINPNEDWQNPTIDQLGVLSTRYSPYTTLLNGSYYWRVRARAAGTATNWGPWSTSRQFTRSWSPKPVPVHPFWDGGAIPTLSNLEFSWTPASSSGAGWVDHAAYFEVQFSSDINFSGGIQSCRTNHTTLSPYNAVTGGGEPGACTLSLVPGYTYYWRIRGIDAPPASATYNASGVLGLWDSTESSDTQRFTYLPDMPDLSCGPAGGSTVSTPVLCWSPVSGAEKYHVIVRNNIHVIVSESDTYATTYTPAPTVKLNPAQSPFEWNVYSISGETGAHGVMRATWPTFNLTAPTTVAPPTITVLSPTSGSHSIRMPRMEWEPVTGADYYKVWYGNQDVMDSTPLSGATTKLWFAAFTYTGMPLATGQIWHWQVVAYNVTNDPIAASDYAANTFQVGDTAAGDWIIPWSDYDTPECVPQPDPASSRCSPQVGDTQELSWTADPQAGAYYVYVAKDAAFTNIYRAYRTTQTTLTPRESWADSQAGESYYWFVRPCVAWNGSGCGPGQDTNAGLDNASAYKKISAAQTGLGTGSADNPSVPGSTIANQITFSWDDYITTSQASTYEVPGVVSGRVTQEAKRYRIQVSASADFGAILDDRYVDQIQYTPWALTYPEGALYWRVQAYDASDLALTMSTTGVVTKSSPQVQLTSPAAGLVVDGVPNFTWEPQDWAAKYKIEVYKNGDTNWSTVNRIFNVTTAVASWSPTDAMPTGVYAWRVQRLDANSPNRPGPWSDGRLFTLSPEAPTLVSPADGSLQSGGDMLFTWTGIPNAVSYRFESSTSAGFSSPTQQTTTMTAWSPTTVYAAGTYYWRVSVLDAGSPANVLSTSAARTFVVGTLPGAPTGVTATAGNTSATVTWTAPASSGTLPITGYIVTSSPDGVICTTTGATTCTVGSLTNGTSYTFTVRAITDVGTGPASSASNAVVPTALSRLEVVSAMVVTRDMGFDVTVRAVDSVGSLQSSYRGAIHFTSSDSAAVLPSDYTFTVGDAGQHTFSGVKLRTYGTFSITATDKVTASVTGTRSGIQVIDYAAATYHAIAPARVLDSRPSGGVVTNIGLTGTFMRGTVRTFQVANAPYVGGGSAVAVPANATAVTGNLTVVNETASGLVALGPTMTSTGEVTTINFVRGETRANNVTVGLSPTGTLSAVFRSSTINATTHLIFDVTGYFTPDTTGATYHVVAPGRVLDSRPTRGGVVNIGLSGKFTSKQVRTFNVAGAVGLGWSSPQVPAGATAITGNVTVTNVTSYGFVSIGPTVPSVPSTSTINLVGGITIANGVTVALNAGTLSAVYVGGTNTATADVIFDVTGYFTADASGLSYYPIIPIRLLDSTTGKGLSGTFNNGVARTLTVGGVGGLGGIAADAFGISGNLTLWLPSSYGFAFAAPSIVGTPSSSTVNSSTGNVSVANGFDVALDGSGQLMLVWVGKAGSTTNMQLDVTGYWK